MTDMEQWRAVLRRAEEDFTHNLSQAATRIADTKVKATSPDHAVRVELSAGDCGLNRVLIKDWAHRDYDEDRLARLVYQTYRQAKAAVKDAQWGVLADTFTEAQRRDQT